MEQRRSKRPAADGRTAGHLARLFLGPAHGGSRGAYLPGGFDLYLRGRGDGAERLVRHHEAQHVLLTDTTAWGAALVLTSQLAQDVHPGDHAEFATAVATAAAVLPQSVGGSIRFTDPPRPAP